MLAVGLKETIDIDVAPALSKCNVIQLIEGLITKKEEPMPEKRRLDGMELIITQVPKISS